MTKIYIVRHGQTQWNIEGKIQGHENASLTEEGLKQGDKIAKRMGEEDIDIIISSDLDRARITAEKISRSTGAPLEINPELREMNFGVWEGQYFKDVKLRDPEGYKQWMEEPESLNIENGENLSSLRLRMEKLLGSVLDKYQGKNIVLVSHGTALKTLILYLLDMPLSNYKNLAMDNVSLSIIEKRDYNNVLKLYNDTGHLGE